MAKHSIGWALGLCGGALPSLCNALGLIPNAEKESQLNKYVPNTKHHLPSTSRADTIKSCKHRQLRAGAA